MHRAKGLTREVVFVVGVEDETIPGRAAGLAGEGEELRLLYVSLTRAKNKLFVTYCGRRTGPQIYTGSTSGTALRHLSRFLVDAPVAAESGTRYVRTLARAA